MKYQIFRPSTLFAIAFAAVTWGGWAYYVNMEAQNAFHSAFLQGTYSGLMTLYMSYSVLFFYKRTTNKSLAFLALPTLGTVGHTGALLVISHCINNTENIFQTVSIPLLVATLYSLFLTKQFHGEFVKRS